MAYKQSGLNNIGNIRGKMIKDKGKTMSTQEMKDIVNTRFRESMQGPQVFNKEDDGIVKKVLITTGSPGATGYKPISEGTSLKDIKKTQGYKSQKALEFKQRKKAINQEKIKQAGRATSKIAKEIGERALDIVSPLVPGLGKRRTFVKKSDGTPSRMVFGSGAAFNEAVDKPVNPRTQGRRFRFGEWQKYKKQAYTTQERRYNIMANVRTKGMTYGSGALVGHGKAVDKGKITKVKDYSSIAGKLIKKGVKKFKGLM